MASISGLLRFTTTAGIGVLLVWKLGATGAALALVLGLLVDLGFASRIVVRHLDSPFRELWAPPQLVGVLAAYAVGFMLSGQRSPPTFTALRAAARWNLKPQ